MIIELNNGLRFQLDDESNTASIIDSPNASGNVYTYYKIRYQNKQYKIKSIEKSLMNNKNIEKLIFLEDENDTENNNYLEEEEEAYENEEEEEEKVYENEEKLYKNDEEEESYENEEEEEEINEKEGEKSIENNDSSKNLNDSDQINEIINILYEIQDLLLTYIDDDNNNNDETFKNLIKCISQKNVDKDPQMLRELLHLISSVSNNHHRNLYFNDKIHNILENYLNGIQEYFSNLEIFNIFKDNLLILKFLIEHGILQFDENLLKLIFDNSNKHIFNYFITELKPYLTQVEFVESEMQMIESDKNVFQKFDEKRNNGQNNSYICSLIQNDSIEEFIVYVTKNCINLNSNIPDSFFETNPFLLGKTPTLIEYAAFFGSMQIIRYLSMNEVDLTPSLWIYSIHSNNPILIHYLEENEVIPKDESYFECLVESIKCHHNSIFEYIYENLMDDKCKIDKDDELIQFLFYYHNYCFMPSDISNVNNLYHYACESDYLSFVKIFQKSNKETINEKINGYTPLKYAVKENNIEIIEFLLKTHQNINFTDRIFQNCKFLISLSIPSSANLCGSYIFSECCNLQEIYIPESVESINDYVFYRCSSLKRINLPSSLQKIGNYSFSECKNLEEVEIPRSLKSIGYSAFENCTSLKEINIQYVGLIGSDAFYGCTSLRKITIGTSHNYCSKEFCRNHLGLKPSVFIEN